MKHLLTLSSLTKEEILGLIALARKIKKAPARYAQKMKGKSLLMLFEKPSLRTRVSFEVGMTQLGGHAIFYDVSTSPLGKGKETIEDTARTASRYVDLIMARVYDQETLEAMAKYATVPVINALSNFSHPCQVLSDLLTIIEKKRSLKLKVAYVGDGNNNVTHSLLFAGALVGFDVSVGCPEGSEPLPMVQDFAQKAGRKSKAMIVITPDPREAVRDADIIYTDTWMSYHVAPEEKPKRIKTFTPYQINDRLMGHAKRDALFMHCLPATRGEEVTASVLDGKQSIVFDQAENRLHMQKAIMLTLAK
ncbi:ornithine carbamoyltransferase [Candidatus Woesearchaeota archaeon]|nr:ornithine carbamoyltransferase [Candidatus Woesearchaeota archaeon]